MVFAAAAILLHPAILICSVLVAVILSYPVAKLLRIAKDTRRREYVSHINGCKLIQEYHGDLATETIDELGHSRFLVSSCDRFEKYKNTFKATSKDGRSTIHTIEPENIQTWSALQLGNFGRYELNKEISDAIWGVGILNSDGQIWMHSRALIRPTFKKEHIAQFQIFKPHVDRLLERLPANQTVNMFSYFKEYIFDSSTEFFFGSSAFCQDPLRSDRDALAFRDAFDNITIALGKRRHIGMQAITEHPDWQKNVNTLYNFIDKQVLGALEHKDTNRDGRDILLYEMAQQTSDAHDLRYQILQVFTPGHESTGSLLSNMVYALATHTDVFHKLRAEIMKHSSDEPTWDVLKSLSYLRLVINETLRMWPLFVSNTRLCVKDTVLPRGGGPERKDPILVKAGDTVSANIFALHHSKAFWGLNADQFYPERWERRKQGWEYLPFNGGGHICPAQNFAITEASYVIFRLLRTFKNIESTDSDPWTELMGLSVRNKNGVMVKLTHV